MFHDSWKQHQIIKTSPRWWASHSLYRGSCSSNSAFVWSGDSMKEKKITLIIGAAHCFYVWCKHTLSLSKGKKWTDFLQKKKRDFNFQLEGYDTRFFSCVETEIYEFNLSFWTNMYQRCICIMRIFSIWEVNYLNFYH